MPTRKKKKHLDTFGESPAEVRFRTRDLRKQEDRDAFGDALAGDMARAAAREDWIEYNRIKAILFKVT